jgi:hypothetical protein
MGNWELGFLIITSILLLSCRINNIVIIDLINIVTTMSTEVEFWNTAEVGIFSELIYSSTEFREPARNSGEKTIWYSGRNAGIT